MMISKTRYNNEEEEEQRQQEESDEEDYQTDQQYDLHDNQIQSLHSLVKCLLHRSK
jgi:hypothetical protein